MIWNIQGSVEGMKYGKYSSLGVSDKRSEILKVKWNGCKIKNPQG